MPASGVPHSARGNHHESKNVAPQAATTGILPIFPHRPHAVDEAVREIHSQLFGGLGLFVLCMLVMTFGVRSLPGDYFNRVLARFANRENPRDL